jgi:hypothetical protein
MDWKAEESEVDPRQGQEIFLFSITCRRPLGPTQPPIHWAPWDISLSVKRQGREADRSSRKSGGAIPLVLQTTLLRGT